jgi:hypothetical protein
MSVSDRAYFLEAIRNNPMTISGIVEQFSCATNTARNWVKHPEVELVEGSYPPAYVRKDTLVLTKVDKNMIKPKPGKVYIEFDRPPTEDVERFYQAILDGKAGIIEFAEEFKAIDSQQKAKQLIHKLKSAIVVTEYYVALMSREGIE